MKRLGSLRFDGVLAQAQRDAVARALSSAGVEVASWTQAVSTPRTYASLRLPAADSADLAGLSGAARFDSPPLVALEIAPRDLVALPALGHALGGPGRPAGVLESAVGDAAILVELQPGPALRLVLDLVDLELTRAPGRTVTPLLPLSDETLAVLAAATLGVPDLDATRLIETFSEPLLAHGAAP